MSFQISRLLGFSSQKKHVIPAAGDITSLLEKASKTYSTNAANSIEPKLAPRTLGVIARQVKWYISNARDSGVPEQEIEQQLNSWMDGQPDEIQRTIRDAGAEKNLPNFI